MSAPNPDPNVQVVIFELNIAVARGAVPTQLTDSLEALLQAHRQQTQRVACDFARGVLALALLPIAAAACTWRPLGSKP